MKRSQLYVILIGIALMFALAAFPPWAYTFQDRGISQVRKPAPRAFLFTPPAPQHDDVRCGVWLDMNRLTVEWSLAVLAASGVYLGLAWRQASRSCFAPKFPGTQRSTD